MDNLSVDTVIAIIFGMFVIVGILVLIIIVTKKMDDNKELIRKQGKIIEKPQNQSSIVYWVTVDFIDGKRKKLRVFDSKIILAVGDEGTINYRGQTIVGFKKN